MEQGRQLMEREAAGNAGGGPLLNKAQHKGHVRKFQEEETQTPGRERLFQPGTTQPRGPARGCCVEARAICK